MTMSYLEGGYFDESGNHKREIYIDWAQEQATKLSQAGMTSSALRKFYSQVKALDSTLSQESSQSQREKRFETEKYQLYALVPLAVGAANSQDAKVPQVFADWISDNINLASQSYTQFKAFVAHFQSVVAFFKETDNRKKR